jgi:hypothetical protein
MGKCIIKLEDKYMQWTTVSDSPASLLLPEPLFRRWYFSEYGNSSYMDYRLAMQRVEEHGCSAYGETPDSVIKNNRAGKGEKKLTRKQLVEAYSCEDEAEFTKWLAENTASNFKYIDELLEPKKKKGS